MLQPSPLLSLRLRCYSNHTLKIQKKKRYKAEEPGRKNRKEGKGKEKEK